MLGLDGGDAVVVVGAAPPAPYHASNSATVRRRQNRRQTDSLLWSADVDRQISSGRIICKSSLLNGIRRTDCQGRNLTDILDDSVEIPSETVMLLYQNNQVRLYAQICNAVVTIFQS